MSLKHRYSCTVRKQLVNIHNTCGMCHMLMLDNCGIAQIEQRKDDHKTE